MRKIPLFLMNDQENPVGYIMLEDTVTDADLKNISITWEVYHSTQRIFGAILIRKSKVKIENDPPFPPRGSSRRS